MAIQPHQEDSNVSNPAKRIRWATQRVTGAKEQKKRHSIIDRFHHRKPGSTEKKRESGGSADGPSLEGIQEEADTSAGDRDAEDTRRTIFFNIPLPDDAKDEEGYPLAQHARNKIRTAKYTPLSFIPKNLWYQFHQIANIYFLFVIVLAVSICCKLCRCLISLLMCFRPIVLQHLWGIQSWIRLGSLDFHLIRHSCEGCHRRLAEDSARQ